MNLLKGGMGAVDRETTSGRPIAWLNLGETNTMTTSGDVVSRSSSPGHLRPNIPCLGTGRGHKVCHLSANGRFSWGLSVLKQAKNKEEIRPKTNIPRLGTGREYQVCSYC